MKAYLVTFTVTTRIVVEDDQNPNENDDLFNQVADAAYEQIEHNGFDVYLCPENCEINPDTECPAGSFAFDANKTI